MAPRPRISVSVIMPAYNVAPYIDEAIRSVLRQAGISFELLIVDDASSDRTWSCIKTYRNDARVRAWCFKRHQGVGAARNCLISRAKGQYLSFCDADDKILEGYLKTLARVLDRDVKIGVVYSDRLIKDRSGKLCSLRRSRGPAETWDLIEGPISNGGTMIRRSLVGEVGGYRTDLPFLEDYDFFWRLAEKTRFYYLKGKPLYFYRKRRGSLSNQFSQKRSKIQKNLLQEVIKRRYGFETRW